MKTIEFDIEECLDLNTMTKTRFGYCKIQKRLLNVEELEDLAKKYNAEFEIEWSQDRFTGEAVPDSFLMTIEDHMYNAYVIGET